MPIFSRQNGKGHYGWLAKAPNGVEILVPRPWRSQLHFTICWCSCQEWVYCQSLLWTKGHKPTEPTHHDWGWFQSHLWSWSCRRWFMLEFTLIKRVNWKSPLKRRRQGCGSKSHSPKILLGDFNFRKLFFWGGFYCKPNPIASREFNADSFRSEDNQCRTSFWPCWAYRLGPGRWWNGDLRWVNIISWWFISISWDFSIGLAQPAQEYRGYRWHLRLATVSSTQAAMHWRVHQDATGRARGKLGRVPLHAVQTGAMCCSSTSCVPYMWQYVNMYYYIKQNMSCDVLCAYNNISSIQIQCVRWGPWILAVKRLRFIIQKLDTQNMAGKFRKNIFHRRWCF